MIRWCDWAPETFARAHREGKPILLSLTASWCHACHRMEEETWDDPGVAAQVERLTVPVRVDADARPDVYGRFHLGGLPTTALLTAEGDFIRGGTFLLAPQFLGFLESALADFQSGRRPGARPRAQGAPSGPVVEELVARLLRRADREHGGFGAAPKLPEAEALTLLLRQWRRGPDAALGQVVRAGLDAILGHLHDPRDGGFFRYAAGDDWSGPHTEKVAIDQARMITLLLEAGTALSEPRYVEAARHGLAHARRRLADAQGRVYASVAADPGYYAEPREGEREGEAVEPPAVDRRRFADAGAAMVSAACLAWAVTGEAAGFASEFREAAPSGEIPHRLDEREELSGLLRDQALGVAAAVDEYRLTGDPTLLEWARRAAEWGLAHLWDEQAGAFRSEPELRGAGPSLPPMHPLLANGEMAQGLLALADHAELEAMRDCARRAVESLAGQALRSPAGAAVALAAQRLEDKPARAEVAGAPGDSRAAALARTAVAALGPTTLIRWTGGTAAALTLCVGDLCLPPLAEPRDLLQSLADLDLIPPGALRFR